ncbi:hypothetical protein CARUB_v10011402mg [Capsella rubella]|uniref:DUF1985 domain-containing protein n=1 Tax=Capsella rubella TaxID=81985 RepID=R0GNR1_9BRAS|nr:hypothetical protein CARUB_v10011402mg [Capsella rubella]
MTQSTSDLPKGIYDDGSEPNISASFIQHSDLRLVPKVKAVLSNESFKKLQNSFLGHIIKIEAKSLKFLGKLFHYIMMRRLKTKGNNLWFRIASQPTRFSMREFFLSTGIQCEQLDIDQRRKGDPYSWTKRKDLTLKKLQAYLFGNPEAPPGEDEKLCLAAVILTEAILMTPNSTQSIPSSRLETASDFEAYTSLAWGKEAYNVLATSIRRMDANTWARGQYEVKGFPLALLIWALSVVPLFGSKFAIEVKTIVGDPNQHSHLVMPQIDEDFNEVVNVVIKGYRMTMEEWIRGSISVAKGGQGQKRRVRDPHVQEPPKKN